MKLLGCTLSAIIVGAGLFAGQALATPIAIANFSFETPEEGNSSASNNLCPPGWTCNPAANSSFNVGVYSPVSETQYRKNGTDGLPVGHTVPLDGSARTNLYNVSGGYQAAYMNSAVTISQTGLAMIVNNMDYTLDLWIGNRLDTAWGGATIQIWANGAVVASSVLADPGDGLWKEKSLVWSSGSGFAGQQLGIALLGRTAAVGQTNFDVVTLNSAATPVVENLQAVPEPAMLALLGIGLVGLGLNRRKSRA